MDTKEPSFWGRFKSRDDLLEFGTDALLLFALQLKFGIEDIELVANNSLTEGSRDKKADLVYIDSEAGHVVIAQTYISQDANRKEAPANKASDLNTAVAWLLSRPIDDLPIGIKPHAGELRQAVNDGTIKSVYMWYVHNLPESRNVKNELTTVEHSANAAIRAHFPHRGDIKIQASEVGISTLEGWYKSLSSPILISEEFTVPISKGFQIGGPDWQAYVTSISAKWLYNQFQSYRDDLFTADVRGYLGSRKADSNINNGIKQTVHDDPSHFWVYNNGITALVNKFEEKELNNETQICFEGISIVNGAQTIGAIGSLDGPPDDDAKVQIRFITCSNRERLHKVVLYNNSQNRLTPPDFRSTDPVQTTLVSEFEKIPSVEYVPRRGGYEDIIRRRSNMLPSVVAGQALAAFHGDPDIAYHEKTHMWEDDTLYSRYFCEKTTAKHIIFAYSLLRAVEKKKLNLRNQSKEDSLIDIEKTQLDFFRKRGSTFLMTSAISSCLEIFLNKRIPNLFSVTFKSNLPLEEAASKWLPIVKIASAFTSKLEGGLSDGFRTRESMDVAVGTFRELMYSTKEANTSIYSVFSNEVN